MIGQRKQKVSKLQVEPEVWMELMSLKTVDNADEWKRLFTIVEKFGGGFSRLSHDLSTFVTM